MGRETRLLPGDVLALSVARRPSLDGRLVVFADGRVRLADGARFAAANATLTGLQNRIGARYGDVRLRRVRTRTWTMDPGIEAKLGPNPLAADALALVGGESLDVLRSDGKLVRLGPSDPLRSGDHVIGAASASLPVTVVGGVNRPSGVSPGTLEAVIEAAGGLRRGARREGIWIRRGADVLGPFRLSKDAALTLLPGDVATIPLRERIERASVAGAVARPGSIELDETPTLGEAIADAGGLLPSPLALTIRIRSVVRPDHPREQFPAAKLANRADLTIHPNDIIEIGANASAKPR